MKPGEKPAGRTDWEKLRTLSDEELYRRALEDPDNPPWGPEHFAKARRANPRFLREKLGMTQEDFARTYQLSLATLRDWEQGRSFPDQAARTLLTVIDRAPEAVKEALAR